MSAARHIQLSMFEPAGKLAKLPSWEAEDWAGGREGMHADKIRDAHQAPPGNAWKKKRSGESFYDNVAREGVKEPVQLEDVSPMMGVQQRELRGHTPVVVNGNHRIAVANDVNPAMEVPVRWLG